LNAPPLRKKEHHQPSEGVTNSEERGLLPEHLQAEELLVDGAVLERPSPLLPRAPIPPLHLALEDQTTAVARSADAVWDLIAVQAALKLGDEVGRPFRGHTSPPGHGVPSLEAAMGPLL
jgi:hypothetical protein